MGAARTGQPLIVLVVELDVEVDVEPVVDVVGQWWRWCGGGGWYPQPQAPATAGPAPTALAVMAAAMSSFVGESMGDLLGAVGWTDRGDLPNPLVERGRTTSRHRSLDGIALLSVPSSRTLPPPHQPRRLSPPSTTMTCPVR
jgi:hypothetical protein